MKAKRLFTPTADLSEDDHYMAALIIVQSKAWVYYSILLRTEIIWTNRAPTAGTDGAYIYINPDYFLGLPSDGQRAFLLAHEVGHIVLRHPLRLSFFRKRGYHSLRGTDRVPLDSNLYNVCTDYIINADLIAHGFEPIPNGMYNTKVTRDALTDEVYLTEIEKRAAEPEPESSDPDESADAGEDEEAGGDESPSEPSDPDDGDEEADDDAAFGDSGDDSDEDEMGDDAASGDADEDAGGGESATGNTSGAGEGDEEGAEPEPSNHGGHDDHFEPQYEAEDEAEAEAMAAEDVAEIERKVDEAIDMAEEMERRGEHPGGMDHGLRQAGYRHRDAQADVDWQQAMAEWLNRHGTDGDVDWSRPNRRRLAILGTIVPSRKGAVDRFVFAVDLSGSISHQQLDKVRANLAACIDTINPKSGCVVIWFTTRIERVDEVHSGQELLDLDVPPAGGCEIPSLAIDWLDENGLNYDALVVFTDGYLTVRPEHEWNRLADADALVVCSRELSSRHAYFARTSGARILIATADHEHA